MIQVPWNASTSLIIGPLVDKMTFLPSGENFMLVHSNLPTSGLMKKVLKGPLSNDLKSYNFICFESMPTPKISPSGSYDTTGRLERCIRP